MTDPFDESADLLVGEQVFDGVVRTPQLFFPRDEPMDAAMAVMTDGDRFLHLLASVAFFKPLVAVACPRDQVMLSCASLGAASTKLASSLAAR